jgi:hypothetical protein
MPINSLPLTFRRAVVIEPGNRVIFTASWAVEKWWFLRVSKKTCRVVDTIDLPDPWALTTVPVRRQRRIIKEIIDLEIAKPVEI